jgi:hypothetical protein
MGKRHDHKSKTDSQRIGTKGERIFAEWCSDRHLTANKVDEDYGNDYICEILKRVSPKREEPTGSVLVAPVRSVEGKARPRIKLFRSDAGNIVQQQQPACLIGVNTATRGVYYRFVDKEFADELHGFLATGARSWSIPLSKMSSDVAEFDSRLQEIRRPASQFARSIQEVRRKVEAAVPGVNLSIRNTDSGSMAMVELPWIGSAFVVNKNHEAVRSAIFERGTDAYRFPDVCLKPEFSHISKVADGALIIGVSEGEQELSVRHQDKSERLSFKVRRFNDEFAFSHDAGITLIHSDRRKRGREWVHELEVRLFSPASLDSDPDVVPFLRLLRPGAQISLNGKSWIDVDTWGPLSFVGPSIVGLCSLCDCSEVKLSDFSLADFKDEELGRSLAFLNVLLGREASLPAIFPGFLLNEAIDAKEELESRAIELEIPIALNVKSQGVIITVRGTGIAYRSTEGGLSGIEIKEQQSWDLKLVPRITKSVYPEIWVDKQIPPVKIGAKHAPEIRFRPAPNENILATIRIIHPENAQDTC